MFFLNVADDLVPTLLAVLPRTFSHQSSGAAVALAAKKPADSTQATGYRPVPTPNIRWAPPAQRGVG